MKLPHTLTAWLAHKARRVTYSRPPDLQIGKSDAIYLQRWWVLPKNPVFNIYVHKILRSDDARALHDHPADNLSILLEGWYLEILDEDDFKSDALREPGEVVFRLAETPHRLVVGPRPAMTLWIKGPDRREWGFHCPAGWRPWQKFCSPRNPGEIGRGCS